MSNKLTLDWNVYSQTSAKAVSEGIVMLRNENNVLPLKEGENVAVFGRIQLNYYKSGTGSGGMVNVSKVIGITDGLIESKKVNVNTELLDVYKKWTEENPFDYGTGWGEEPWSQKEMPLEDSLVDKISKNSNTAIVIIGRTAGEEQDNKLEKGAYLLSDEEDQMLSKVRKHFNKMVVLLNVGGLIDLSFIDKYSPESVLFVWQGGMVGGTGTADVLVGNVSPSGKLPDTIAYSVSDYPSDKYFGDINRNFYCEDIYVGYRYFETFAKDKVMFPFGYGLSYTKFKIQTIPADITSDKITLHINVKNIGKFSGKEVVQIYCSAPQGKLGKPSRVLCGYEKTIELAPDEEDILSITIYFKDLASFDDMGVTGHKSAFVLEAGEYKFYVGTDVRSASLSASYTISETIVVEQLHQALAPVLSFNRMKAVSKDDSIEMIMEEVPATEPLEEKRRLENMPKELSYTGDKGIKLSDVLKGNNSMDEFIAQLSDDDLACIIRGEGMGSPKVTAGTASAFGGVSDGLASFNIPCGCCSDGPSGMRLDCGTKAFSLPNGTLLASTFNKELITELFTLYGLEARVNKVDCLLGPGMNIHRHPLNGRNFEYFSEDPFLTGTIATAELKGLHSVGVTGTIKHFCGNNQETGRHSIDSVISERALREIYLKGFEMAIKDGKAPTVMTTYGSVNGLWTAGSYDLTTTILRDEWGFEGFAMTDWWANINTRTSGIDKSNFAAMARAQNDVYMVCADGSANNDNTLASLKDGTLMRSELQRNAANICGYTMKTHAMKRLCGEEEKVELINCPDDENNIDGSDVKFYDLENALTISLQDICTDKGTSYAFALDVKNPGFYKMTITGSSNMSELAQIPVTLFSMGTASGTFTWNGTNGKNVSFNCELPFFSRFTTNRLYFAQSGMKMDSISFEYIDKT